MASICFSKKVSSIWFHENLILIINNCSLYANKIKSMNENCWLIINWTGERIYQYGGVGRSEPNRQHLQQRDLEAIV
jgi:hypothetical protein